MNKNHITYLKDYTPSSFLIKTIDLTFQLDPKKTIVNAYLKLSRNPQVKNREKSLKLNGKNLKLTEIKLNNKILRPKQYNVSKEFLIIFDVPDTFTLETTVIISPEKNLTCSGLYLSDNNFTTQNEPYGFRRITYFLDRPDIMTKFKTTIIADKSKYPVLLSNGNLIDKKTLKNNLHQTIWEDPFPKSAYLFALVAGNLSWIEDFYTTQSGRKITLRIFAKPNQLDQCHHAMFFLKQAMHWDEENFGLEYDLDLYQIVAVDDFNFGAMENKGLNIFNTKLLLSSPKTATDADFRRVAAVIAHEYFHNWTGNRITCRDWFQIGLKEGLTTLREQLFMEDLYGETISRIDSIKDIYTRQFVEDASPLAHPIRLRSYIDVNNFYTSTVYEKSAEVSRMIITIFGRKTFIKIMKKFLKDFDGKPATIDDFLQTAVTITKTDLKQFRAWYDYPGTPILKIKDEFKNNCYHLKITQENKKANKNFQIPLKVGLLDKNGKNINTKIIIIDKKNHVFHFKNITKKPTPSLLRNFSAPIRVEYPYTDDEMIFLITKDQDPIIRWETSKKLLTKIILKIAKSKKIGTIPTSIVGTFSSILNNESLDPSLAAQILEPPDLNSILLAAPKINIEKIHNAAEFIKTELARSLKQEFLYCYEVNSIKTPYEFEDIAVGKRDLKNICLSYLSYLDEDEIFKLLQKQLKQSDNLTDTLASLIAIANSNFVKRDDILEIYYHKWRTEPGLTNKWLAINASIKDSNNLQRIKKLVKHPSFNLKNPNKVYALIRTFTHNNLVNFHATDGSGYKFITDQVLKIDRFNSQVAALIAKPLIFATNIDQQRKSLLKKQIKRIKQHPKLSSTLFEIISKN